jgi:hypothetical protein
MVASSPVVVLENLADDGLALNPRERPQLRQDAPRELVELVGGEKGATRRVYAPW